MGALRGRRYADLYRSAAAHPSPMGDKTPYQRAIRGPAGLAEQQPAMEQLHPKLSRALALPPPSHAQIPPACERGSCIQAGEPPEITCTNPVFPRGRQERASKIVKSCAMSGNGPSATWWAKEGWPPSCRKRTLWVSIHPGLDRV